PQPTGRRPDLPAEEENHPDPESATRGTQSITGVGVPLMRSLEEARRLVFAAEHESCDRKQLQVWPRQRRPLVSKDERVVALHPCQRFVGRPPALELARHGGTVTRLPLLVASRLVDQDDDAVPDGARLLQLQPLLVARLTEQSLAAAEHDRKEHDVELIDQIVLEERLRELAAAVDDDRAVLLLL